MSSSWESVTIDNCVIVIKSGSAVTNLHKELRQAYEIIFRLLQKGIEQLDKNVFPTLPANICIETQEKGEELWAKVTFDGNLVIFDDRFDGCQIFDATGNITCRKCLTIVADELTTNSTFFKASYPVIIIHVKITPNQNLASNLIFELSHSLELLTESICEGDDLGFENRPVIRQAVITKTKLSSTDSRSKFCIDNHLISDREQTCFFSNRAGMIKCDNCQFVYHYKYWKTK